MQAVLKNREYREPEDSCILMYPGAFADLHARRVTAASIVAYLIVDSDPAGLGVRF